MFYSTARLIGGISLICCAFLPGIKRASADVILRNTLTADSYDITFNGKPVDASQRSIFNNYGAAPFGDSTIYASKDSLCVSNSIYSTIIDKKRGSAMMVFPALKQYITIDAARLSRASEGSLGYSESAADCTVTDLGKTEKIAGHVAHEYSFGVTIKNDHQWASGHIWLCRDFPDLDALNTAPVSANGWVGLVLRHVKGVPLKLTCELHKEQNDAPLHLSMTSTGIGSGPFPSFDTQPPPGYTEIKADKTTDGAAIRDAISHVFVLALATSSPKPVSARMYGVYTGGRKTGTAAVISLSGDFEGTPVNDVTITLASSDKTSAFPAGQVVTYESRVNAAGAPLYDEVKTLGWNGKSSKVTARYLSDRITLDRYDGDAHTQRTITVPAGVDVYPVTDIVTGFSSADHLNLGWAGIGVILDPSSMSLKTCKISTTKIQAQIKDPVLGDHDNLVAYAGDIDRDGYRLYEDRAGNAIYAELPGTVFLRREKDEVSAQPQPGILDWIHLDDATKAVKSDISLTNLSTCKSLLVDIQEPGKTAVSVQVRRAEPIDHGGDLSEIDSMPELKPELENTAFMSLTSPSIARQASEIKGGSRDLYEISTRLCDWVHQTMTYSGSTILQDDRSAADILSSREGVCRDYAVLYTALARAAGIPTRLCSGIVLCDGKFGYHEWAETYMGKKRGWIAVDPTLGQHIADATHILVNRGDNSTPAGTTFHIISAT